MNDLRPLWIFLQVARHGSLSSAAQALSLSPAALSKSVSRLEARLGVLLFTRTTRSLQITDEGRRLFEQLDNSFSDIQAALHDLRLETSEVSGSVRLSTVTGFGRTRVLPILGEFFERFPHVDLMMSLHDGARGLSRHAYDVRINWGEEREQTKVAHRLSKMELVLVGSPSYIERCGIPRKPRDLEDHDCISVSIASNQRARWQFTKRNGGARLETIVPHGRLIIADELASVVDAAVAGLGLTVVARDLVAAQLARGELVQLLASYAIEGADIDQTILILQHPQRRLMSPATRALVDFLIEKLKQPS